MIVEWVSAIGSMLAGIAALLTLIVAVVAAFYAKGQLDAARGQLHAAAAQRTQNEQLHKAQLEREMETRKAEALPYVTAFTRPLPDTPNVVELVIKNFGTTPAYDVVTTLTPPGRRTSDDQGADWLTVPDLIPFLAPGQEWATAWDFASDRKGAGLEDRHDAVVMYASRDGEKQTTVSTLDWSIYKGAVYVQRKTMHHAVGALEGINRTLRSMRRHPLKVHIWDGAQEKQRRAAEQADWDAKVGRLEAQEAQSVTPSLHPPAGQ